MKHVVLHVSPKITLEIMLLPIQITTIAYIYTRVVLQEADFITLVISHTLQQRFTACTCVDWFIDFSAIN